DLGSYQDALFIKMDLLFRMPVQRVDDPSSDILHVSRAAVKVGIVHPCEGFLVMIHHLMHGSGSSELLIDEFLDLADETPVFEYQQMGVKNGGIFFRESVGNPLLHIEGLDPGLFKGEPEFLMFLFR